MKKLVFVLSLLFVINTFGQEKMYDVARITTSTSATITSAIKVPPGYFVSKIAYPALATGTSSVSYLEEELGTYKEVWHDGEKLTTTIKTDGNCIDFPKPSIAWNFVNFKIVLGTSQTSDLVIFITFQKSTDKQ